MERRSDLSLSFPGSITLRAGPATSEMWEWFNDLGENDRLQRILRAMKAAAWGEGETPK